MNVIYKFNFCLQLTNFLKEGKVLIEKQICILNVNMVCKYFLQYILIQKSLVGEEGVGEGVQVVS